jgi:hypothetical protein
MNRDVSYLLSDAFRNETPTITPAGGVWDPKQRYYPH